MTAPDGSAPVIEQFFLGYKCAIVGNNILMVPVIPKEGLVGDDEVRPALSRLIDDVRGWPNARDDARALLIGVAVGDFVARGDGVDRVARESVDAATKVLVFWIASLMSMVWPPGFVS